MTGMAHWKRSGREYWRLAADFSVTILAEAALDRVCWEMGSRVDSLFERVLVAMGASVGGLVGVACDGGGVTLGRGALGWGLWATLGGGWGAVSAPLEVTCALPAWSWERRRQGVSIARKNLGGT